MERTYRKPGARAGLGALTVLLVLLGGTGTCVASGAAQPVRLAELAEAAPLGQGAGYGSAVEAKRVRVLQRVLRKLGWAPGGIDGLFGPRTEAAVLSFQAAAGLTVDGVAGPNVWAALAQAREGLRRGAGYAAPASSQRVRVLQRRLKRRGLRPGPVDGRFGPRTEAAVARLQRAAKLESSGAVDSATRRVLARPERQDGDQPASTDVRAIDPQTARSVAVSPLADPGLDAAQDGGLPLWMLIAVAALVIAAMSGGLIVRGRSRARAFAGRAGGSGGGTLQHLLSGGEVPPPRPQETIVNSTAPRQALRAIGYVSVPQTNDDDAGAFEAQAGAIESFCESRGWELLHVVRDVENGHAMGLDRPGLLYAMERLAEGEASCLVVSQLERLSRSAADLGRIVAWLDELDGRLVAIDLRLDTGSSKGRLAARTLVTVGEWEGRRMADRTANDLGAARARRATTGRPAVADQPALKERIVTMRKHGLTLQAIADQLNAERVPTLRGGSQWRPSSVQSAVGYRRPKVNRSNLQGFPNEDHP